MLKLLGDAVVLLCGVYFISLGLGHIRPQVFATVGSLAISGVNAQVAGGCVIFLGIMLFLDDFLSGRASSTLLMGLAGVAIGVLWIRARRIDLLAPQAQPTPIAGYCYLGFGAVIALFGLWSLLPA
jgi:hypothetical protein